MKSRVLCGFILCAWVAGCATVPLDEQFQDVQTSVTDRTGYDAPWAGVTADGQSLGDAVARLLADGLTADEAAQLALLNNPRLQAVYSEYGIAVADLVEAGLLENPIFDGELRWVKSDVQIIEASVVQDFLSVLFIPLRKAKAKAELERARLHTTAEVIDVAMDTKRAFYHYQADLQNVEMWRAHLLADEAEHEMALALRRAGNIPARELSARRAQYEQSKQDVAEAENDLAATREQLNRMMGLWGEAANWQVAHPLPDAPPEPLDVAALEQRAIEKSLDLAMGLLDVEIAARIMRISNVEAVLPELSVGAGFESEEPEQIELREREIAGERSFRLEESRGDRVWEAGPALTVPIPLFNQGQAARARGRNAVQGEWAEYTALATELRSAARAGAYRLEVAQARALNSRDTMLPLMEQRMNDAQLQYNGMFIGVFDLLDAKKQEINAAQMYVTNLMEYWLARTDMEQILMGRMVIRAPEDRPDIINADVAVVDDEEEH